MSSEIRLAALFSIGQIADRFARSVGWSPVGRKLVLEDAEGPDATAINGLIGEVVTMTDGTLVLEVPADAISARTDCVRLRLTPRHVGWTGFSLIWTRVAVVVESFDRNSVAVPTAIAFVKIYRR